MVRITCTCKTIRFPHKHGFIEDAIEEGVIHVELSNPPAIMHNQGKHNSQSARFDYRPKSDMIPRAKKQRYFKALIPNLRIQNFNEEFHGLQKDDFKLWLGLILQNLENLGKEKTNQTNEFSEFEIRFLSH